MLRQGASKGLAAAWLQGDALRLPVRSASMDYIFSVYMLHHIPQLDRLLHECARVLGHGCAAFVTTTHRFIRRHPMNAYFPSFAGIDTARFQDIPQIFAAFQSAGFTSIGHEICQAEPAPIDAAYVERVAGQFISTYALLPKSEFEDGLIRLRRDVAVHGRLPGPIVWESAIVWGFRAA